MQMGRHCDAISSDRRCWDCSAPGQIDSTHHILNSQLLLDTRSHASVATASLEMIDELECALFIGSSAAIRVGDQDEAGD